MTTNNAKPVLCVPADFHFGQAKYRHSHSPAPPVVQEPLGVLANFQGDFAGTGFNSIFRPNSVAPTTTTFPNPVSPPPPGPRSENVLELNLTAETLSFSTPLGSVPNRGLVGQTDIFLNGVPYVQVVKDVTNPETGKGDGTPVGIHFEPGLWMHVPATTAEPVLGESLVRMASIPHGTTINAPCLAPSSSTPGPPTIPAVSITPFSNNLTERISVPFASQTASNTDTPRLPQDLTAFIAAGTITQDILDDPNTVLRNAIAGQKITNTVEITVSTFPTEPDLGGGTSNIAFLQGTQISSSNSNVVLMSATFWIETVQHDIEIPVFTPGQPPLRISAPASTPGAPAPVFLVQPPHAIHTPTTITVTSTQIQYSQLVMISFATVFWPHVSVATLVPTAIQHVPASAFN